MAKTKPVGIRFDEKKLELIKKERMLTTNQQVVNWLLENYESVKKPTPIVFKAPTSEAYDGKKLDKIIDDELGQLPREKPEPEMPKGLSLRAQIKWAENNSPTK